MGGKGRHSGQGRSARYSWHMSNLSMADLVVVDALVDFVRGKGYVLDFSDRTFSQFFSTELGVDIYDDKYAEFGTSKGKRLRRFLMLADNSTAAVTLKKIWEHRKAIVDEGKDPVPNAETKCRSLLHKLGMGPHQKPTHRLRNRTLRVETLSNSK